MTYMDEKHMKVVNYLLPCYGVKMSSKAIGGKVVNQYGAISL